MVVKEVVVLVVACLLSGLGVAYLLLYVLPLRHNRSKCVAVLVLGDIGRSPRMQNHAVALANAGWKVELIGFKGNMPVRIWANFRGGSIWRCIGVEGQDSCQLFTINTESTYNGRKSPFPSVWPSEGSVSDLFTVPSSTHCPSILIHSCPGTIPFTLLI